MVRYFHIDCPSQNLKILKYMPVLMTLLHTIIFYILVLAISGNMASEIIDTMDTDQVDRKRKQDGGSTGVSPEMKKQYSRVSSELPLAPIPELESPNRDIVMNLVVDAFNNKTFIDKISPSLQAICQPITNAAINEAVARAVSKLERDVIKPLKEQNQILRETVKQKDEAIIAKDELLNLRRTL